MREAETHWRGVAVIVAAAFFMENLDATVIVIALPTIARSFNTDAVALTIGVTGYLVALAAVLPASAWLANRFGTRNVFCAAIAVFTVASVLCGLSGTVVEFAAARILQGAGAALMSPVGRFAVLQTTKKSEIVRAIALITWPGLIAPVLGPPLGGFIASYVSWRWIFFLNVPLGLIGMVLVWRFIPNFREPRVRRFDLAGFVMMAVALATMVVAIEIVAHSGVWLPALGLFAVGGAATLAALRHFAKRSDPLLDLSTFRIGTFAAATLWGGSVFRLTSGAMPYLLPLFFQIGFGMSAVAAGFLVLAYAAGNLAMKSVTTFMLARFGFRTILLVNGAMASAAILACAALTASTPELLAAAVLFVAGCLRSMQLTALATVTFVDVPDDRKSAATLISTIAHQLSSSIGVAVAALILNVSAAIRGGDGDRLSAVDFQVALIAMGIIAAISVLRFRTLDAATGAEVSGHRRSSVREPRR